MSLFLKPSRWGCSKGYHLFLKNASIQPPLSPIPHCSERGSKPCLHRGLKRDKIRKCLQSHPFPAMYFAVSPYQICLLQNCSRKVSIQSCLQFIQIPEEKHLESTTLYKTLEKVVCKVLDSTRQIIIDNVIEWHKVLLIFKLLKEWIFPRLEWGHTALGNAGGSHQKTRGKPACSGLRVQPSSLICHCKQKLPFSAVIKRHCKAVVAEVNQVPYTVIDAHNQTVKARKVGGGDSSRVLVFCDDSRSSLSHEIPFHMMLGLGLGYVHGMQKE